MAPAVHSLLKAVSVALTAVTGGYGIVAIAKPQLLGGGDGPTPQGRYFAQMYAARTIPLAAMTISALRSGRPELIRPALRTAAAAQLGDALIGARHRQPGQVVGPLALAALYVATCRSTRAPAATG